jgi:hypothetical protein
LVRRIRDKQRKSSKEKEKSISLLERLEVEFLFNTSGRGNKKYPFETTQLEQVQHDLYITTRFPGFFNKCSKLLQIANDANKDGLKYRKMVPSDAQEIFLQLSEEIPTIIALIKQKQA